MLNHGAPAGAEPQFDQASEPRRNTRCLPRNAVIVFVPGGLQNVPSLIRTDVCGIWNTSLCSTWSSRSLGEEGGIYWYLCLWVTLEVRMSETDVTGEHFFPVWDEVRTDSAAKPDISSAQIWNTCIIHTKCRTSEKGGKRKFYKDFHWGACNMRSPFIAIKLINERQKCIC